MHPALTVVAAILGGGLSGACVSVIFNRLSRWRELRTRFHAVLRNMFSIYFIRLSHPEWPYLTSVVCIPAPAEDKEFIEGRSSFVDDLVQFNELREARLLRRRLLDNGEMKLDDIKPGRVLKVNLVPEVTALETCLFTVQKKLNLFA